MTSVCLNIKTWPLAIGLPPEQPSDDARKGVGIGATHSPCPSITMGPCSRRSKYSASLMRTTATQLASPHSQRKSNSNDTCPGGSVAATRSLTSRKSWRLSRSPSDPIVEGVAPQSSPEKWSSTSARHSRIISSRTRMTISLWGVAGLFSATLRRIS
jgi:hypothetical protein